MDFDIRKLRHEDKRDVLQMIEGLWDGDDYMPQVFDQWVEDETGEFTAALYNGVIAGCSKLTFLAAGHAWLEGLRSDLDFKPRGMAKALTGHHLDILRETPEIKSVRFATYIENYGSIITAERLGFKEAFRLSVKSREFELGEKKRGPLDIEVTEDKGEILRATENARFYHQIGDNFLNGWRVYPMEKEIYRKFIAQEDLLLMRWKDSSIMFKTRRGELNILMMDIASISQGKQIMYELEKFAVNNDITYSEIMIPGDNGIKQLMAQSGYESWLKEDDFIVYEYPLADLGKGRNV